MDELSLIKYHGELGNLVEFKNLTKKYLETENNVIDQLDEFGDSILHGCVNQGRLDIVEYLLTKLKAKVNIVNNSSQSTPLHKAATIKDFVTQINMIKLLMTNGADPLIKNQHGLIPEQISVHTKCKEMLQGDKSTSIYVSIDKSKVGRIVGKGGANLREIRESTNTMIQIPDIKSKDNRIKITGRLCDVENAKEKILYSIMDRSEQEEYDESQMEESPDEAAQPNFQYLTSIPKDKHKLIIGAGGKTINHLRQEYNVKITIPPSTSLETNITIQGTNEAITEVMKYINEKILAPKPPKKDNNNNNNSNNKKVQNDTNNQKPKDTNK
ncbi:ankyrin repeat-containing protein [Tieghemostelium lacteum]|uniref:Ankyrin repeat-containing protein n=1 Tax=Tieghemostelium lacteum TaxID=361077 RepID=A0A152A4Z1_TIELA|nr:ankyrin repeat-containing protein [Tieghemostelium lacteum]|eukprot:KYR01284.1 ankyrin repeat-containing protein [Tieghemostelium lacteum]